ncbi:hypothetical protein GCM10023224_05110 [Streptomonospora halophila]|uniref:Uncharacterized protein n=1 Tax=Streptomonospora halophila TaxID=427369 RepID=A0ABP9GDY0_9ACTN
MVVQPVYATAQEWVDYSELSAEPARASFWLRRASRDVDVALIGVVYEVDSVTQQPADADVAEALQQATIEQADMLVAVNDPTGAKSRWDSVSVGQVTYKRRGGSAGDDVKLSSAAADILRLQGLTPQVWTAGWC